MSDLPNRVYDVVIELVRWSVEHPKLYFQTGGVEGYLKADDCGCKALEHVPAEVRDRAEAIRDYRTGHPDGTTTFRCQRCNRMWVDDFTERAEEVKAEHRRHGPLIVHRLDARGELVEGPGPDAVPVWVPEP